MEKYESPIIDLGHGNVCDGLAAKSLVIAAVVVVGIYGAVVTTGAAAAVLVAESGGAVHFGVTLW